MRSLFAFTTIIVTAIGCGSSSENNLQGATATGGSGTEVPSDPTCGNGVIDLGEACDGTALPSELSASCNSFTAGTLPEGTLGCGPDCHLTGAGCMARTSTRGSGASSGAISTGGTGMDGAGGSVETGAGGAGGTTSSGSGGAGSGGVPGSGGDGGATGAGGVGACTVDMSLSDACTSPDYPFSRYPCDSLPPPTPNQTCVFAPNCTQKPCIACCS